MSSLYLLRGLPSGYPKTYRATLSEHPTLASARAWGALSGLASDGRDRFGRLWIERKGQPATLPHPVKAG